MALEPDRAARRRQKRGQQIEAGRLAGAVRPDQRVDLAGLDAQIDVIDGDEAAEFTGQSISLQDDVVHPWSVPSFRLACWARRVAQRSSGRKRRNARKVAAPGAMRAPCLATVLSSEGEAKFAADKGGFMRTFLYVAVKSGASLLRFRRFTE